MGDHEKDKLEVENIDRKEKRLEVFEKYIKDYKEFHLTETGVNLETIDAAASKLTNLYFAWLDSNVKPYVPKRINKYKISSLAELCIVKIQPFLIEDESQRRKINADFAFFTTLSIIFRLPSDVKNFNKPSAIKSIEDLFETVKSQRLQWLEAKNPNTFPVFSNGLNLYLLFEFHAIHFHSMAI